jgi:hypothetical protein
MYANKLALAISAVIHSKAYTDQQRRDDIAWLRSLYEITEPNVVGTIGHVS